MIVACCMYMAGVYHSLEGTIVFFLVIARASYSELIHLNPCNGRKIFNESIKNSNALCDYLLFCRDRNKRSFSELTLYAAHTSTIIRTRLKILETQLTSLLR